MQVVRHLSPDGLLFVSLGGVALEEVEPGPDLGPLHPGHPHPQREDDRVEDVGLAEVAEVDGDPGGPDELTLGEVSLGGGRALVTQRGATPGAGHVEPPAIITTTQSSMTLQTQRGGHGGRGHNTRRVSGNIEMILSKLLL